MTPQRKPSLGYALAALIAGVVLAGFELRRINQGGEVWFWLAVGALMIALGTAAVSDAIGKRRD